MLFAPSLDALQGFVCLFVAAERGETDIPLARGTEADTGGADDVGTVEQGLEELPGRHAVGAAHPDVGGILAAVALVTESTQRVEHLLGVLHVVVDGGLDLLLALWRVDSLGGSLTDITTAIELGTLTAQPQLVERYAFALKGTDGDLFWNNGIAATYTRESCRFGVGTELDGALAGSADLVDGVRYLRILDVRLIGCIIEDKGIVLQCIVHPLSQFLLGDNRTCGVVGIAEVDDIYGTSLGKIWNKTILCIGGHIAYVGPTPVAIRAATANHHVGVDIDGIDRVGHADEVVPVEQLLEIARVRLCTVVDEDLVDVKMNATRQEVVLQDSFAQEVVTLFRTVATESFGGSHLVDSLVHGLGDGRTQRLGDVANAETDDVGTWVHHLKGVDLLGDVSKQVVLL